MKFKSTLYLTGLRGYAALGVFIGHVGVPIMTFTNVLDPYHAFGGFSILSFFILSSFGIFLSLYSKKVISWKSYAKKRFFRIAPLYYLVLLYGFIFVISGWKLPSSPKYDFTDLLYHISFLNLGEIKYQYQNSMIGIEWFIPILMFYYCVLPFMFMASKKGRLVIAMLVIGVFLFFDRYFYQMYTDPQNPIGFHWSLQKYFFIYILGGVTMLILYGKNFLKKYKSSIIIGTLILSVIYIWQMGWIIGSYLLLLSVYFLYLLFVKEILLNKFNKYKSFISNLDFPLLLTIGIFYIGSHIQVGSKGDPFIAGDSLFVALFTIVMITASYSGSFLTKLFLENKFIVHLGKISFSFYLLQMPVLLFIARLIPTPAQWNYTIRWFELFIGLVIFSSISYYFIEKKASAYLLSKFK
jgi:peptidoglycan/LPS O-acetylase OafA/YrhL